MGQVQAEYGEIDIWKVNEFKFLNEEFEEFTGSRIQDLVDLRSASNLNIV